MTWLYILAAMIVLTIIEGLCLCPDLNPFSKENRGKRKYGKIAKYGNRKNAFDPVNSWHGYRKD